MPRHCLDPRRVLAASHGESLREDEKEHLETCRTCGEELAEARRIAFLVRDLGLAERSSQAAPRLWHEVESRLDAPGLRAQMPLPLAGLSRLALEILNPRVATAWAVGLAGLLFGIWLAPRSPSTQAQEPYSWSNLVEDRISLSAVYESSFPVQGDGSDSRGPTEASSDDSSTAGATPVNGARP